MAVKKLLAWTIIFTFQCNISYGAVTGAGGPAEEVFQRATAFAGSTWAGASWAAEEGFQRVGALAGTALVGASTLAAEGLRRTPTLSKSQWIGLGVFAVATVATYVWIGKVKEGADYAKDKARSLEGSVNAIKIRADSAKGKVELIKRNVDVFKENVDLLGEPLDNLRERASDAEKAVTNTIKDIDTFMELLGEKFVPELIAGSREPVAALRRGIEAVIQLLQTTKQDHSFLVRYFSAKEFIESSEGLLRMFPDLGSIVQIGRGYYLDAAGKVQPYRIHILDAIGLVA